MCPARCRALGEHRFRGQFVDTEGHVLRKLIRPTDADVDTATADEVEHRGACGEAQRMGQREVDDGRADPDPRCRGDHVGGEIKCVGADAVIEEVLFGKPKHCDSQARRHTEFARTPRRKPAQPCVRAVAETRGSFRISSDRQTLPPRHHGVVTADRQRCPRYSVPHPQQQVGGRCLQFNGRYARLSVIPDRDQ
jgi:hypothetical protein